MPGSRDKAPAPQGAAGPPAAPRGNGSGFRRSPRPPRPESPAPSSSPSLPSFLVKAVNKDFIFPLAGAAGRRSLYNLLGLGTGERWSPAPRRRGGVDPGRGGGHPGTARLRASPGMPDPARWRQSPPHSLPVSWERCAQAGAALKPRRLSPRPSCARGYSAFVSLARGGGSGSRASWGRWPGTGGGIRRPAPEDPRKAGLALPRGPLLLQRAWV